MLDARQGAIAVLDNTYSIRSSFPIQEARCADQEDHFEDTVDENEMWVNSFIIF
jgi:hypothetical protein